MTFPLCIVQLQVLVVLMRHDMFPLCIVQLQVLVVLLRHDISFVHSAVGTFSGSFKA